MPSALFIEAPAYFFLRAPVVPITPGTVTASTPPHTGVSVVTRGVIGGAAALLAIGAMALVVWRRRRQSHKRASVGPSFQSEIISVGTQATVTPFNLTGLALTEVAPLDAGPETDLRQLLVHPPPALEGPPAVTVPVGLSSKELARLRSLANASHSQPTGGWPSDPPLVATTEGAANAATSSPEAQSLAQRLQSENNILRHEIEQLRGGTSELPPSYASDVA
ncbi:hypothetical protein H4582DRAFT_1214442 [Lactarius indigo]|nr:hypothetical protein H4582DRAFT_1214442 [Lactarius indigo]